MKQHNIYIGYDPIEDLDWWICAYSIAKHSSISLNIIPLKQDELRKSGLYSKEIDQKASNQFSQTRFLAPYLNGTKRWCIFCDCDMIFTSDVRKIFDMADKNYSLMCVKHDYVSKVQTKMDGKVQYQYPRKNWASLMLLNGANEFTRQLTPELVNKAMPAFLHRMEWTPDQFIGALPIDFNFLVGEYDKYQDGKLPTVIHLTHGSPTFKGYENCDYSDIWYKYRDEMLEWRKSKKDFKNITIHKNMNIVLQSVKEREIAKKGGCNCS